MKLAVLAEKCFGGRISLFLSSRSHCVHNNCVLVCFLIFGVYGGYICIPFFGEKDISDSLQQSCWHLDEKHKLGLLKEQLWKWSCTFTRVQFSEVICVTPQCICVCGNSDIQHADSAANIEHAMCFCSDIICVSLHSTTDRCFVSGHLMWCICRTSPPLPPNTPCVAACWELVTYWKMYYFNLSCLTCMLYCFGFECCLYLLSGVLDYFI